MRYMTLSSLIVAAIAMHAEPFEDYLRTSGKPPVEYVLAKLDTHRVVIAGESHWMRSDAELVAAVVPELRARGVSLAMEILPGHRQEDVKRLVTAEAWDVALANDLLKTMDWPYRQYRDILQAAWNANRATSDHPPITVLALGPPRDFREKGIRYDEYMAERAIGYLRQNPAAKLFVYCGMHHGFTRYLQVERRQRGRATEFMDRFGNILWRKFGQDVFLIAFHKSEMCGPPDKPEAASCAPFNGAIDCAGASLHRPVGFDVLGSPVAELKFPSSSFYTFGHPLLRFHDYADGYIWSIPIDEMKKVDLIPLEEFSPGDAKNPTRIEDWTKQEQWLAREPNPNLASWRKTCGAPL